MSICSRSASTFPAQSLDDSPSGRLALHLGGLLAKSRGITTTVLQLGRGSPEPAVRRAIDTTDAAGPGPKEQEGRKAHVTLRTDVGGAESAVTREARKGYDLLMLGIMNTMAVDGGFHEDVARVAAVYKGPLAVVAARGGHIESASEAALNILVPVRGNTASRRASEVALALARASESSITALYVLSTVGLGAAQRRLKRPTLSRNYEEAVLKEIVGLAERFGRTIRTALRLDVAPEDAILRQARLGSYNLIVMGVGRPGGDTLFFGKVAAAVLENSERSILFLST